MAVQGSSLTFLLFLALSFLITFSDAVSYCGRLGDRTPYFCDYGCCGDYDEKCCDPSLELIIGLCVAGVLILIGIVFIICICHRYQHNGFRAIPKHQAAMDYYVRPENIVPSGVVSSTNQEHPVSNYANRHNLGHVYPGFILPNNNNNRLATQSPEI